MAGHTSDVAAVEAALVHREPRARVVAVGAAARLGLLDPSRLAGFLADPSADVRYRALEVTPALSGSESLAPDVIALLDDPRLSEIAAFTLGELSLSDEHRQVSVTALCRQANGHDDALSRESAVAALGALGDGLPAILAACEDVATVRRRAVLALAPFDGPDVEAALDQALQDRDWQVRQAAEDLLGIDNGPA